MSSATTVLTEDGYTFTRQPDGSYTDGDLTYPDLDNLKQHVNVTPIEKEKTDG